MQTPDEFVYYVYVEREEVADAVKFINPFLTDDQAEQIADQIKRTEVKLYFMLDEHGKVSLKDAIWNE